MLGVLHNSLPSSNPQFTGGYCTWNLARHTRMKHLDLDLAKHWRCVQYPTQ
jgi:hypothetical protein